MYGAVERENQSAFRARGFCSFGGCFAFPVEKEESISFAVKKNVLLLPLERKSVFLLLLKRWFGSAFAVEECFSFAVEKNVYLLHLERKCFFFFCS